MFLSHVLLESPTSAAAAAAAAGAAAAVALPPYLVDETIFDRVRKR